MLNQMNMTTYSYEFSYNLMEVKIAIYGQVRDTSEWQSMVVVFEFLLVDNDLKVGELIGI